MAKNSRAYTADECREMMFEHIIILFKQWRDMPKEDLLPGNPELDAKMSGFLHSLFVMFSGGSDLPGLKITVDPEYANEEEVLASGATRWWPENVNLSEEFWHEVFPWGELMNPDALRDSVNASIAAAGGAPSFEIDE